MATVDRPPMGRERRRKDLIGRTRRFLYGLLLLAAAPGAVAADELAYIGKYRGAQSVAAATQSRALAKLQGLVLIGGSLRDDAPPLLGLDTVTAEIPEQGADRVPHFQILATATGRVRDGAGFDLAVNDFGTFNLDLLLRPDGGAWLLGGTLELTRAAGLQCAAAVPEVRVQGLHRRETRYLPFEAALKQVAQEDPKLAFKWRA